MPPLYALPPQSVYPMSWYQFVFVRVSIPGQNIMTKKQVGEERVCSAYTSMLLFITKGSQELKQVREQELMQRPWRDVPSSLACFPWLAQLALL